MISRLPEAMTFTDSLILIYRNCYTSMYLSYTLLIVASTEDASISLYIHIHMIIHIGAKILFILCQLALSTHLILISPYASVSRPDLVSFRILAMLVSVNLGPSPTSADVLLIICPYSWIIIQLLAYYLSLTVFLQNPGSLIYAQANYYLINRVNTHLNLIFFSFPSIYRYNPKWVRRWIGSRFWRRMNRKHQLSGSITWMNSLRWLMIIPNAHQVQPSDQPPC